MVNLDCSVINKATAKSFNEQRNLIKKIANGGTVLCTICQQPLQLTIRQDSDCGVSCKRGCTRINLELEG